MATATAMPVHPPTPPPPHTHTRPTHPPSPRREFDEAQFLEFVAPTFQQLAGLLSSSCEFDSQLAAFSLLDLVVDRLADGVRPYAPGLLALLPSVWQQAEGQSLLRIQVGGRCAGLPRRPAMRRHPSGACTQRSPADKPPLFILLLCLGRLSCGSLPCTPNPPPTTTPRRAGAGDAAAAGARAGRRVACHLPARPAGAAPLHRPLPAGRAQPAGGRPAGGRRTWERMPPGDIPWSYCPAPVVSWSTGPGDSSWQALCAAWDATA